MLFDMREGEKSCVFIDGANLYSTSRALGFDVDYRRLKNIFFNAKGVLRAYYFTAISEDQEYSSVRPLVDWLDYNGYSVVTRQLREYLEPNGRRKVKGNMDVELAVRAFEMSAHVDHIILFSGDGGFRPLVKAIQRKGRRVTVVSSIATQPSMASDDLRRQADCFVDLVDLMDEIGRDVGNRE